MGRSRPRFSSHPAERRPSGRRSRRLRATACAALALLAGCGDDGPELVAEQVGRGREGALVVRPEGGGPQPVVVFLHGWGATDPRAYRPWLDHLARAGNAVIAPRYQDSALDPPPEALPNALAGIRAGLARVRERPGTLVVAGHSAGGALAADYAAIAPAAGLPPARGVFAAYPGRRLRGIPVSLPPVDPERIPAGTDVLALAGAADTVVGEDEARALAAATGGRFERIARPGVADHGAPLRADPLARATFWRRLDRLISAARR